MEEHIIELGNMLSNLPSNYTMTYDVAVAVLLLSVTDATCFKIPYLAKYNAVLSLGIVLAYP